MSGLRKIEQYRVNGRIIRKKIGNTIESITLHFSKDDKKYKEFKNLLFEFGSNTFPTFEFNTVTINHNYVAKRHRDCSDIGESIIFGLGDYSGGELIVGASAYNIKNVPIKFNGSKIYHETKQFKGDRWTFIFFNL